MRRLTRLAAAAVGILAIAGGALAVRAGDRADEIRVIVDRTATLAGIEQALRDVAELEHANDTHPDPGKKRSIGDRLIGLRTRLRDLRQVVEDAPRAPSAGAPGAAASPGAAAAGPVAMDERAFGGLLEQIKKAFATNQLALIDDAVAHNWFTSDQVAALLKAFTFGKDQVEAGARLYPRTVDKGNFFRVYEVFTFDSDKKKLRERVGGGK